MFEKILVATDGSAHAGRAVHVAADLASRYESKLEVVHATRAWTSMLDIRERVAKGQFPDEVLAEIKNLQHLLKQSQRSPIAGQWDAYIPAPESAIQVISDETLSSAVAEASAYGAKSVDSKLLRGDAAEELIEYVRRDGFDLIVMGTRGLSGMREIMLGSVSQKVLHAADCPCLTVK
jgi:nucleotide-binding universal stress UspA family protein